MGDVEETFQAPGDIAGLVPPGGAGGGDDRGEHRHHGGLAPHKPHLGFFDSSTSAGGGKGGQGLVERGGEERQKRWRKLL